MYELTHLCILPILSERASCVAGTRWRTVLRRCWAPSSWTAASTWPTRSSVTPCSAQVCKGPKIIEERNAKVVCFTSHLKGWLGLISVADPKQKFRIRFRIRIRPRVSFGSVSGFESRIRIQIKIRNRPKFLFLTKKSYSASHLEDPFSG